MHSKKGILSQPVMAVMVSRQTISNLEKGIVHPRIKLLVEANQKVGLTLYHFSMDQVHLRERCIMGYYWSARDNAWLRRKFPFPDILYLRGGITKAYTPVFKELLKDIYFNNGRAINYPRFNKWHLYQTIAQYEAIRPYLPVTITVNEPNDIRRMLQKFGKIYLKSHNGRKGEGVFKVETLPRGAYRYSFFDHYSSRLTYQYVSGFPALLRVIYQFFSGRRFLAQQAIELISFHDRLIDMRAEMQRNGSGNLEIVGISVRLGQPHSPIATHGDAYSFDHFFTQILPYPRDRLEMLRSAIEKFLFTVYHCIEAHYGEYVEIGIDFGLDINGRLWLIEPNSQSTRISLEKAYGDEVVARANLNILKYARHVAARAAAAPVRVSV